MHNVIQMKITLFLHHLPPFICLPYLLMVQKNADGDENIRRERGRFVTFFVPHSFPFTVSSLSKEDPTLGLPVLLPCDCDFPQALVNRLGLWRA